MANIVFDKVPKAIEPNLIQPIRELRTDICPNCQAQRIELFSFNGYPQHYSDAVDAHLKGYDVFFNKYEIRSMKCRSCNKEFTIDWTYGFPQPLKDTYRTTRFLQEFFST